MPGLAVAPRLFYLNLFQASTTVLVPSSEQASLPRANLLDQLRSRVWRTKVGWVIVAGVNDRIDFNRGGVKSATIAAGYYATSAALCAAIVAALEAADATPVWASTYAVSKFTISSDLAFVLLWFSGANKAASVAYDIGFAETDTGSATSQTGSQLSYQSRHFLHADFGSSLSSRFVAVINHNLSAAGVMRLDVNATSMLATGFGAAVTQSQNLTGDIAGDTSTLRAYFTPVGGRYARLVISDGTNPSGYAEIGIAYLGDYLALTSFAPEVTDDREELSSIAIAINGAHFQNERQTRRGWSLNFHNRSVSEKAALITVAAVLKIGKPFFFDFDSNVPQIRYVFLDRGLSFKSTEADPVAWDLEMRLSEALG